MIRQLTPDDPEYTDVQIVGERVFDPSHPDQTPLHHMDRDCWCHPEIVAVEANNTTHHEVRHR